MGLEYLEIQVLYTNINTYMLKNSVKIIDFHIWFITSTLSDLEEN